ncbi:DUF2599 domain-containing protein [Mycolicibacillus parakoreensis]
MRRMFAALLLTVAASVGAPAHADTDADPAPLIGRVEWAHVDGRPSLRIYPTAEGREAAVRAGATPAGERAWSQVLAQAPDAAGPGMYAQFRCHWDYAELARPGKPSWNLEPWRPVVSEAAMLDAECNPGAPERSW